MMHLNNAAGSYQTKKLCSSLLSTEVEFYWQNQQNRVLCQPLMELQVTHTFYLWLVGKRVVLFEHFLSTITVEPL